MIKNRYDQIDFYSPLGFVKGHDNEVWRSQFEEQLKSKDVINFQYLDSCLFYRRLDWDSGFFGVDFFRLEFIDGPSIESMISCVSKLIAYLDSKFDRYYIFSETPCEDTWALQAFNGCKFKVVETRICWYRDDIREYDYNSRSSVRFAQLDDIENLRSVASKAINQFDKYHADDFFGGDLASSYLETFIENSVKGFADVVLVPANGDPGAFLTGNYLGAQDVLRGRTLGKMILSAVTPERTGWYTRLISEMSFLFKEQSLDIACMTTQATNRAVIKVWQRLGYLYGRTSHVVSYHGGSYAPK